MRNNCRNFPFVILFGLGGARKNLRFKITKLTFDAVLFFNPKIYNNIMKDFQSVLSSWRLVSVKTLGGKIDFLENAFAELTVYFFQFCRQFHLFIKTDLIKLIQGHFRSRIRKMKSLFSSRISASKTIFRRDYVQ